MLSWLLVLVPVALAVHWLMPEAHSLVFGSAAVAIIPLAGWMGRATEALAARAGEGVGGLLNATFGNAAELVIALAALRHGLYDVVKASIAGSIIGNILLVLGAAMLAGGLRFQTQHYNITAARSQATMLLIAAISFVFAGAFRDVVQPGAPELIGYTWRSRSFCSWFMSSTSYSRWSRIGGSSKARAMLPRVRAMRVRSGPSPKD